MQYQSQVTHAHMGLLWWSTILCVLAHGNFFMAYCYFEDIYGPGHSKIGEKNHSNTYDTLQVPVKLVTHFRHQS